MGKNKTKHRIFGSWWGPYLWLTDSYLSVVSSYGKESQQALISLLLRRTLISLCDLTFMISSKPNYLRQTPPPNIITWGVRASKYEFGRGHKHSIPNSGHVAIAPSPTPNFPSSASSRFLVEPADFPNLWKIHFLFFFCLSLFKIIHFFSFLPSIMPSRISDFGTTNVRERGCLCRGKENKEVGYLLEARDWENTKKIYKLMSQQIIFFTLKSKEPCIMSAGLSNLIRQQMNHVGMGICTSQTQE